MSGQLYKVRLSYPYDDAADTLESTFGKVFAQIANCTWSRIKRLTVLCWLKDEDREQHLQMIYDNGPGGLTIVISDRDTALLMKLALS